MKFLYIFCFLIISCDLPGEADRDCNGINNGLAEIDDCGICSGGDTEHIKNSDKDCDGECFGDAIVDDCEICSGDNTGHIENSDQDCLGDCFGDAVIDDCGVCGGNDDCDCPGYPEGTIQDCFGICAGDAVIDCLGVCMGEGELDVCGVCNGPGVIDCMCESYITSNTNFNCDTNGNSPYAINEQLSCETLDTEFSLCYPEDCDTTFKFSDFEDKIIWIIYEADW